MPASFVVSENVGSEACVPPVVTATAHKPLVSANAAKPDVLRIE